ncbi:HNH endonuclease signature motif containing protein [Roseomonas chloroacetimidivorans]|uniref:HNH endonuclease signature motif containing protein n=1 Tax=Roseomonas chloroacetimidivorans TaxID=1766656 RepID=UPI003C764BAD
MCDACVEWGGRLWHRTRSGYYEVSLRLHRAVWEAAHGPIPDGYHVHHISGDKSDNRLENLVLLTHGEHSARHYDEKLVPHRARAAANGRAAMERNRAIRLRRPLSCAVCGGIFHSPSSHPTRFCSSACVQRARSGAFGGEKRICLWCAGEFDATKREQKYCSRVCNNRATAARPRQEARTIQCAHCSKPFTSARANARFCERACALAFHAGNPFRGKVSQAA